MLVDEAIRSALDQVGPGAARIVIVNDGCPDPQTALALRSWAEAHPDRIAVVHRPNGGLSAARNTGIRWLLANAPEIEAIFLLDADNRLDRMAMRAFSAMLDRDPAADWFYPEFDFFGLDGCTSNGGPYSVLFHSAANTCEAGSLVRRRVFDAGLRFDESMKLGYEDWDFWLTAAGKGFRGAPMDAPAFRYRKRPESMLAGSHRDDSEIRSYMRRKHRWIYSGRGALALEHAEAPRYRLFTAGEPDTLAFTDPRAEPQRLDEVAFASQAWEALNAPHHVGAGAFWVAADPAALAALDRAGMLRFAFWDLERRLEQGAALAVLRVRSTPLGPGSDHLSLVEDPEATGPGLAAVSIEVAERALRFPESMPDLLGNQSSRSLSLPDWTPPEKVSDPVERLRERLASLARRPFRGSLGLKPDWRGAWTQRRSNSARVARRAAGTGVLYPALKGDRPRVCFLLNIAEFGGVERVTAQVAAAMRRAGLSTALCVVGTRPIQPLPDLEDAYEEVFWGGVEHPGSVGDALYLGTRMPNPPPGSPDLVGLLAGYDAVILCHPTVVTTLLGELRGHGVLTAFYEHLLNRTQYGRIEGGPVIALAYEAAADLLLTCSEGLRGWLTARGVPARKVLALPNAAGYPIAEDRRIAALEARRALPADRPLRALFIGRFDPQKGVDRLVAIVEEMADRRIDMDWRVVGKPVLSNGPGELAEIEDLVDIRPATSTPEGLTEHFAWADVIVLPSRYEGLPLTIVEAQRVGTVPIAADAGQVSERIVEGEDGFVVTQKGCVAETVAHLARLSADRAELARMSETAAAGDHSWDRVAAPLIERVNAHVAARAKKEAGA